MLRAQTDSLDPMDGAVLCSRQYAGYGSLVSTAALTSTNAAYNPELARLFHQWTSMCTFTPTRAGDYYLQVRTNVALAGTGVPNKNTLGRLVDPLELASNPATASAAKGNMVAGAGSNMFSVRAVPTNSTNRAYVSVSGYSRMPIFQNASGSTAIFNLIRAETEHPASKYINFEFYDAGDATGSGTIRILKPNDASGSLKTATNIPGCRYAINNNTLTAVNNCTAPISSSANNGQVGRMQIPVPSDYSCQDTKLNRLLVQGGGQVRRRHQRHRLHHLGRQHRRHPGPHPPVAADGGKVPDLRAVRRAGTARSSGTIPPPRSLSRRGGAPSRRR